MNFHGDPAAFPLMVAFGLTVFGLVLMAYCEFTRGDSPAVPFFVATAICVVSFVFPLVLLVAIGLLAVSLVAKAFYKWIMK